MAVTLEQAALNAVDDIDVAIIDEFRTSELMNLMAFDDVVNPAGGGATLTYGYRRTLTLSTAAFRAINSEYKPSVATTKRFTVDLVPLGGSYEIDRVLANIGPAASGEVAFQTAQKIRATQAEFAYSMIQGDTDEDENGFDGLSKALTDSDTEYDTLIDWSPTVDEDQAFTILENLDDILALMDGEASAIITNKLALAKIRSAARRTAMYTRTPGPRDTWIERYGNAVLVDAGKRAGINADIIPVAAGLTELYAVRFGLDAFHGVSVVGAPLIRNWLPDFSTSGAVKTGEVEMGPVAVCLKRTKAAAVARNVRVSAAPSS